MSYNEDLPSYGGSNPAFQPDFISPYKDTENDRIKARATPEILVLTQLPSASSNTNTFRAKLHIWKNLVIVSSGFLLLFTSFGSLQNLQSSLNAEEGLGTASLSVIYAALIVSCLFTPTVVIRRLGCKWTIVGAMLMYSSYFIANFWPSWWTFIPGAIILGTGGPNLWSAKCTYLTQMGNEYAELVGERGDVILARFFGFFFMMFQSGQIWGNLISSAALASTNSSDVNFTSYHEGICGSNYCNEDLHAEGGARPKTEQVTTLIGIYLGCALLAAVLVALAADNLPRRGGAEDGGSFNTRLLVATFRHIAKPVQILLIPLTFFSGLEQAFLSGDFTKAFVTCSWGIHRVGQVMICYGIADAVCSMAFDPVVKRLGRMPLFLFGASVNVVVMVTMLSWTPDPTVSAWGLFLLAGAWGVADAVWQTQINALYGIMFKTDEEAAFSNYRLWESLGFIVAFATNGLMCIYTKIYILMAVLVVGIVGYLFAERVFKNNNRVSSDLKS